MSSYRASVTDDRCAAVQVAPVGPQLSAADRKQAELFVELLDEQCVEIALDIRDTATALVQRHATDDLFAKHRLRQSLAAMSRTQNEVGRLLGAVRTRLDATKHEESCPERQFDIIMTRRRAGWRMQIPEFKVAMANIDSRADAEDVARSIIAAVTGLPTTAILVRSVLANRIG